MEVQDLEQKRIPVSYTHLDVYKRQVVHSMVDYYLALLIWQPVSRAAKLPASFTFSKS